MVPSATSLHRQLARAMGLIDDLSTPSERNRRLLQPRVFDLASLESLFHRCGFEVVGKGGLFIKPFTHDQMALCTPLLPSVVMDGLWRPWSANAGTCK